MGIPAPAGVAASGLPPAGDQANAVLAGQITAVGPTQPFALRGPMNLFLWASVISALTTTAASLGATVASATGLAAGAAINSANVPRGTTIGALSGLNVTLATPPLTLYGQTRAGVNQITNLPQTSGLVGKTVTGPGVPSGTTVLAVLVPAVPPAPSNVPNGNPGTPGSVQLSAAITSAPTAPLAQPFTFLGSAADVTVTGADANASFTGASVTWSGTVQVERSFDGGATFLPANAGNGVLAQYAGTAVQPVSITFGEPEKQMLYRLNCLTYASGTINYRFSQTGGAAESLAIGPLSNG